MGCGSISWRQFKAMGRNQVRSVSVPIFARRLVPREYRNGNGPSAEEEVAERKEFEGLAMLMQSEAVQSQTIIGLLRDDEAVSGGGSGDEYLGGHPLGYLRLDIEVVTRKRVEDEFVRKLLTMQWFQRHSVTVSG